MDNPLIYRAIERVAIVIAAIVFAYLGYRLFVLGHTKGPGRLQTKSRLGEIIVSGTGPGLLFMAFGGLILLGAIFHGDYSFTEKITSTTAGAPQIGSVLNDYETSASVDAAVAPAHNEKSVKALRSFEWSGSASK